MEQIAPEGTIRRNFFRVSEKRGKNCYIALLPFINESHYSKYHWNTSDWCDKFCSRTFYRSSFPVNSSPSLLRRDKFNRCAGNCGRNYCRLVPIIDERAFFRWRSSPRDQDHQILFFDISESHPPSVLSMFFFDPRNNHHESVVPISSWYGRMACPYENSPPLYQLCLNKRWSIHFQSIEKLQSNLALVRNGKTITEIILLLAHRSTAKNVECEREREKINRSSHKTLIYFFVVAWRWADVIRSWILNECGVIIVLKRFFC